MTDTTPMRGRPTLPDHIRAVIDTASDARAAEAPPLTARQIAALSRITRHATRRKQTQPAA